MQPVLQPGGLRSRGLESSDRVRADFDRLAHLAARGFDYNATCHGALLAALPADLGHVLDLGCGAGEFTLRLARSANAVLGVDLSDEMLRRARDRCAAIENIVFERRDVLDWQLPERAFDCIVSVATLHHLPLAPTLRRLALALRPGGTLAVLDLVRDANGFDVLRSVLSAPIVMLARLRATGTLRDPADVRAAWAAHAATDRYPTLAQVRAACTQAGLDGARVRRLLPRRYLLVWRAAASNSVMRAR